MDADEKDSLIGEASNKNKRFPAYFANFSLPKDAIEQEILGYRACKTNQLDEDSFTPSYEENGFKVNEDEDPLEPSVYSLSLFEKPKDVRRFAIINSDIRPPMKIAIGYTEPSCGVSQRTRERTKKKTSHIDWWLYEGAKPYLYFVLIEDFKTYLEWYKKK